MNSKKPYRSARVPSPPSQPLLRSSFVSHFFLYFDADGSFLKLYINLYVINFGISELGITGDFGFWVLALYISRELIVIFLVFDSKIPLRLDQFCSGRE